MRRSARFPSAGPESNIRGESRSARLRYSRVRQRYKTRDGTAMNGLLYVYSRAAGVVDQLLHAVSERKANLVTYSRSMRE